MTTFRRFRATDLFKLQNVNLDPFTENYTIPYYLHYLLTWPDYFTIALGPGNRAMGYIMGKAEGLGKEWHGHVSAVTVAPEYRRQGLAGNFMRICEQVTESPIYKGYFVDLFVRVSNKLAIQMYEKFGYAVYRRVLNYYSYEEDAFDMRKATIHDPQKESMVPLKHPVNVEDL